MIKLPIKFSYWVANYKLWTRFHDFIWRYILFSRLEGPLFKTFLLKDHHLFETLRLVLELSKQLLVVSFYVFVLQKITDKNCARPFEKLMPKYMVLHMITNQKAPIFIIIKEIIAIQFQRRCFVYVSNKLFSSESCQSSPQDHK